jgi:Putative Flp pilus-assembly TadE/G-like
MSRPGSPKRCRRPSLRRPDPSDKGRKGHLSVQSLNRTSGGLKNVPKSGSLVEGDRRSLIGVHKRDRDEGGQTLIFFVLAMPLFLAIIALVIDGSMMLVKKRALQNAADATALAIAQDVGSTGVCTGACLATATYYIDSNGGTDDPTSFGPCGGDNSKPNCFQTNYHGNPSLVEVRLTSKVGGLFTGAIGLKSLFGVSARSVAGTSYGTTTTPGQTITVVHTGTTDPGDTNTIVSTITVGIPGNGNGVAFAKSTACPAITYNGTAKGAHMGSFSTNGGVSIGGNSDKTIDSLGIGRRNDPGCFVNQAGATINNVVGPFSPMDWLLPLPTVPTPPSGCHDLGTTSLTFTSSWNPATGQGTNPPGIYCLTGSTGTLTLSSDLTKGNATAGSGYTFFAPCISVSGGSYKAYRPPSGPAQSPPTIFYASAPDSTCGSAISIQGGGATIDGDIFAPNGQVSLQGGGVSAGTGFIESQTIKITGNSANFQGNGPVIGGTNTTTSTSVSTRLGTTDPGTTIVSTAPDNTSTSSTNINLDQ